MYCDRPLLAVIPRDFPNRKHSLVARSGGNVRNMVPRAKVSPRDTLVLRLRIFLGIGRRPGARLFFKPNMGRLASPIRQLRNVDRIFECVRTVEVFQLERLG